MSREVIQGLAILEQDLSATATATAGADAGEGRIGFGTPGGKGKEDRGAAGGWGLGGVGPVLKTQTIVSRSDVEGGLFCRQPQCFILTREEYL